jgi:hypothetical protein
MSIANFYKTGLKDQDIIVDNLVVNETATINNLDIDNLEIDDLTVEGTANFNGNVNINDSILTVYGGNIISDGNISSTGNGQLISNGLSSNTNSVSSMLRESGIHQWNSASGTGQNPLVINLNGDTEFIYKIYISYDGNPLNSSNYLFMRLNNVSSSIYSSRITQNTTGLIDNNSQSSWNFIYTNSTTNKVGFGTWDLWCNKSVAMNDNAHLIGLYSSQTPGSNSTSNYKVAHTYNDGTLNNISSLRIDVSDNIHTGWKLYYRIIRMS